MLDVRTEERFPSDHRLDGVWMDLVRADPAATIFHSSRFLRRWCRHLRGRCDLRLRLVWRDGDLVGVVPEVREREDGERTVAHFAGGYHVTDYLGPVSRPEDRSDVVDGWFDALSSEGDWDELTAGGLAEDAGWHDLIAARAASDGYEVSGPTREDVCPVIDVSGGWDAYLDRLSSKQRHEIRRKARRLSREAVTVKLVAADPEDLHVEVDRFVELAATAEGDKGRFFDDTRSAFFHSLAAEFGPDRRFRIHRIDVDEEVAAYTVSLVFGDRWGLYNSAFERSLGHLSPGMVLVGELIRIAAEQACGTFDLLRGDEPYKYRFGAVDRPVQRVVVRRNGS